MTDVRPGGDPTPINAALIPERILVDTGVLIRALEFDAHAADPRALDCRDFWRAALMQSTRRLLVAAPSVTELIVKPPGSRVPRTRQVLIVSFDVVAAELLAEKFPQAVINSLKGEFTKEAIRYDSLIAACALRHRADAVISLDERLMKRVCEAMGVRFCTPGEFRVLPVVAPVPKQGDLFERAAGAVGSSSAPPPAEETPKGPLGDGTMAAPAPDVAPHEPDRRGEPTHARGGASAAPTGDGTTDGKAAEEPPPTAPLLARDRGPLTRPGPPPAEGADPSLPGPTWTNPPQKTDDAADDGAE